MTRPDNGGRRASPQVSAPVDARDRSPLYSTSKNEFVNRARAARFVTVLLLGIFSVVTSLGGAPPASGSSSATVDVYNAPYLGSPPPTGSAVVGIAALTNGAGYYVLRASGEVDAYGATSYGSLIASSLTPGSTATGIALDPATGGYWVVASNGVVQAFNAPTLGETLVPPHGWGQHPAAVAIAAAPDGSGYYVLRANGAVYGYGLKTHGSLAGRLHYGLTAPIVAVSIAVDPTTGGYWIATSNGGVYAFDAPVEGSPLGSDLGHYDGVPASALVAIAGGTGYDVLRANGQVWSYGGGANVATTAAAVPEGSFASAIALDAATGGYYVAVDGTPLDGYYNPLRAVTSLLPQEIDQGVDYCGSGPVYALGDGVVVNDYEPQWPGGVFISYRLSNGPAEGRYVYLAENVTPSVRVGQRVTPTTVIGVMHDATTCIETGWADPPASPERARGHVEYNGKNSTAFGLNFSSLLAALGARPGLLQYFGPPGPLPAAWPTW